MCDCAMKYMMNVKGYLDRENNEVAHGWQMMSSSHWFSLFLVRREAAEV